MYYILESDSLLEPGAYSAAYDGADPEWEITDFLMGRLFDATLKQPVEIRLYEYDKGDVGIPDYFDDPLPMMSQLMIDVLEGCGVDNIQLFPVILKNKERNLILENYKAVNIIGVIEAADMKNSDYIDMGGTGKVAVGFRNLVVDEEKAKGALMFRLAESLSTVLIHEKLKEAIEKCGLKYLRFIPCVKFDVDEEFNVDDYDWDA